MTDFRLPQAEHVHRLDCTVCTWSPEPITLPDGPDAYRGIEQVERIYRGHIAPHIDATGHTVRLVLTTHNLARPGSTERSTILIGPRSAAGAATPDSARTA